MGTQPALTFSVMVHFPGVSTNAAVPPAPVFSVFGCTNGSPTGVAVISQSTPGWTVKLSSSSHLMTVRSNKRRILKTMR